MEATNNQDEIDAEEQIRKCYYDCTGIDVDCELFKESVIVGFKKCQTRKTVISDIEKAVNGDPHLTYTIVGKFVEQDMKEHGKIMCKRYRPKNECS